MDDAWTYQEYLTAVERCVDETHWRYGQALFNVLHDVRPDISEKVRATGLDPFYARSRDDAVIRNFLLYVGVEWDG